MKLPCEKARLVVVPGQTRSVNQTHLLDEQSPRVVQRDFNKQAMGKKKVAHLRTRHERSQVGMLQSSV